MEYKSKVSFFGEPEIPVALEVEDLRSLERLAGPEAKFRIETDDCVFDSVDELVAFETRGCALQKVSVHLPGGDKYQPTVLVPQQEREAPAPSEPTRSMHRLVRSRRRRRRELLARLTNGLFLPLVGMFLVSLTCNGLYFGTENLEARHVMPGPPRGWFGVVFCAWCLFAMLWIRPDVKSVFITPRVVERWGTWRSVAGASVLAIFSALVGALITKWLS